MDYARLSGPAQALNPEKNPAMNTSQAPATHHFQILSDIAKELAGTVVFPTSFDAALRLRKELQNPDLPTARIASIVGVEPLIATKLMHLAGSALYSPDGSPAKDLRAAISRLGVELVRTTALTIAMSQIMRSRDMEVFSDLTCILWDHTLKTAAAARILARTQTRINPDEALLAGLVHDLGAFYLLYRAAQYPELRAQPEAVKGLIVEWHENIGVTLLNALGMSEAVVAASTDHDQVRPPLPTVHTLADIIYVGSLLDSAHFAWMHPKIEPEASETATVRLTFADLLPDIEADAQAMQAVFA